VSPEAGLIFEVTAERLMALLLRGLREGSVTLFVDVTDPGVVSPPAHGTIILSQGPHLRLNQAGISSRGTFVPWSAVSNMTFDRPLPVLTLEELDQIAAEQPTETRRLRRITQLDVFDPAEHGDDAEKISDAFAAHGLRAV
jgi:hypothetical protein